MYRSRPQFPVMLRYPLDAVPVLPVFWTFEKEGGLDGGHDDAVLLSVVDRRDERCELQWRTAKCENQRIENAVNRPTK